MSTLLLENLIILKNFMSFHTHRMVMLETLFLDYNCYLKLRQSKQRDTNLVDFQNTIKKINYYLIS